LVAEMEKRIHKVGFIYYFMVGFWLLKKISLNIDEEGVSFENLVIITQ
jgi:hypothetical protein